MIERLVLLPFVFSFLISAAITSIVILVYRNLGLVDRSTARDHAKHIHQTPVPRGGGIPILIAMLLTTILFVKFDSHIASIFAGATILAILGVLDDLFDLSPYVRLLLGTLAASLPVLAGIGITFITNPLGGGTYTIASNYYWLADALAILWIVWGINFVNMGAKGLDGQLPGVTAIAAAVMGILSFRFVNDITAWPSATLAFALCGAYAGLLWFNKYPQKIMPGWGGGALAGYFLAVLAILSGAKVATAMIVLGVPLVDVMYAVIRRVMEGKSPVWGDDQHLHHSLLKLGWSKPRVAAFYWLITLLLGIIALNLNARAKIYTIVLIGVIVGGGLLWIRSFLSSKAHV